MKNSYILALIFAIVFNLATQAQQVVLPREISSVMARVKADTLSTTLQQYLMLKLNPETGRIDTVSYLYNRYVAELDYLNDPTVPERYIATDASYYKLFVPIAYFYSPIARVSQTNWKPEQPDTVPVWNDTFLPFDKLKFTKLERTGPVVDRALMAVYLNQPERVVTTERQIRDRRAFRRDLELGTKPRKSLLDLVRIEEKPEEDVLETELVIHKPNWWVTGGSSSLQLTQSYISSNWYKGGQSSNSMLGNLQVYANYNDKKKAQWENLFEARLGFQTLPSDEQRNYLINTDLVRLYSKLGIQAASNWYYTVSGEFNTQFAKNYKQDGDEYILVSSFMSPANLIFSVGMDYKLNKKKFNLSVFISPLAYNLRYVSNGNIDVTNYGIDEKKKTLHDIGSKLQTTLSWKITSSVSYDTRFYYFTSYKKVEAEWENTFNFVLNRYLSTKLFIHARYDDGVARVEDKSYFQLKELLSFGLNYKW